MQYSASAIAELLTSPRELLAFPEAEVSEWLYDSRRMRRAEGTLFIAISGKQHNGHDYLYKLFEKGVRHFLVEYFPEELKGQANFYLVKDSLLALQQIAQHHRQASHAQIIGITGSNGKTIVKEWLAQVLQSAGKTTKNPKSYNSQLGVPLSLLRLKAGDAYGVFEAGISQPGEMKALAEMIAPEVGIFTNIGSAHQEHFESLDQKILEKAQLFQGCKKVVYRAEHTAIAQALSGLQAEHYSWSSSGKPARVQFELSGQAVKARHEENSFDFALPFQDDSSVENALHLVATCLALGLEPEDFTPRLKELHPLSMRLEMHKGRANTLVINDAYSNDLESLKMALEYFVQQSPQRKRLLILSDIDQSGLDQEQLYRRVADLLLSYPIDQVYAVGEQVAQLKPLIGDLLQHFGSTAEVLRELKEDKLSNRAILLKGARRFAFEELAHWLEEKSHETILEVYLARVVDNLNYYRGKLERGVKTMVMIKANGYGVGSVELASLLQFHKVDYLAVAYADEGVELRKAGIELPIMILNTEIAALDDILEFKLEPEVYSIRILEALLERLRYAHLEEPLPIHLKLETGMHRLGFEEGDLERLMELLNSSKLVQVQSAFSHLAAADDAAERSFTEEQIERFLRMTQKLESGLGKTFMRHILNTPGMEHYPEAQFEMVRLGIGLYGVSQDPAEAAYLKTICSLKATVSQVKQLEAGESLGYGRAFVADGQKTIATISIGYADGFRRSLSLGVGEVYIRGQRFPVVGKVCMDMCMADISGSEVQEGDSVEIFGQNISLYELAEKMDTIPYEVLTSISNRVKRLYLME